MLSRFHLIPERNGQTDGETGFTACCYTPSNLKKLALERTRNRQLPYKP